MTTTRVQNLHFDSEGKMETEDHEDEISRRRAAHDRPRNGADTGSAPGGGSGMRNGILRHPARARVLEAVAEGAEGKWLMQTVTVA